MTKQFVSWERFENETRWRLIAEGLNRNQCFCHADRVHSVPSSFTKESRGMTFVNKDQGAVLISQESYLSTENEHKKRT